MLALPLSTVPAALAARAPAAVSRVGSTAPKPTSPDHYSPRTGVQFNEPYNRIQHPYAIRRQIVRSINSTVRGDKIRMASWNIRGRAYTSSLIKAHRRGVSVRVVMDRGNDNATYPNPDAERLRVALAKNDAQRTPDMRSALIRCRQSCRGTHGIAHSKFFLFDHVGTRHWVTMYGSNNATDVAVNSQWNDLYTIVDNEAVYRTFDTVFEEMSQDRKPATGPFRKITLGNRTFSFYPYSGPAAGAQADPDLAKLRKVRCQGATGGAGWQGHTKVRIAQDAILGERGIAIAKRLVTMRKRGCDIRLIYSLLGRQIHTILRNGGVPMLQYAYDRNRDGMYDIYLHMKSMAISGVYAGQANARVVFDGTANWSPVALVSDEVVGEIHNRATTTDYIDWIDYLYTHRPPSWGPTNLEPVTYSSGLEARRLPVDPYALMRREGL